MSDKQLKTSSDRQHKQAGEKQAPKKSVPPRQKRKRGRPQKKKKPADTRQVKTTVANTIPSGTASLINQVYNVNSELLQSLSIAYVCQAIQKGWLSQTPSPGFPFGAWQYISGIWASFVNGTVPPSLRMPYWMWCVARAISPKSVPKGRSSVYYKGQVAQSIPSVASLQANLYGYNTILYEQGSTDIDLWPVAVPPSSGIDPDKAFLALCGFMESVDQSNPVYRVHDSSVVTSWDKDVSAFCSNIPQLGGSFLNFGGTGYIASLEVPIYTPAFSSLLAPVNQSLTGAPTRFPVRNTTWSGDQTTLSALFAVSSPSHWKSKVYPKFKFIDFLEFGDVLGQWAGAVLTNFFADPANKLVNSVGSNQNPLGVSCPLTLQEFLLLLRNDMLYMVGQTQPSMATLLPILPQSTSDNQFAPFMTGTTCTPLSTQGMLLPQPLVENVRSLLTSWVRHGRDVEFHFPVIGKYVNDTLETSDYQFVTTDVDGTKVRTNVFRTSSSLYRVRRDSKGASVREKMVETPIDLIDGATGSQYLFINDQERLKALCALWNEWIQQYSAYTSALTILTVDKGITPLYSLAQTRYWFNQSTSDVLRHDGIVDIRLEERRNLSATVYANRQVAAVTYYDVPIADCTAVTNMWILPSFLLQNGPAPPDTTPFVKLQTLNNELYIQTFSGSDSGMSVAALHTNYALAMAHARDGKSLLDLNMETLNNKGQAGILSSLAARFIGNAFGDTAGNIASSVADMLPI